MKKTIKKAGILMVITAMLFSMASVYVSAAEHDPAEDVSSEIATLILGKELSYINRQYNPVEKVIYTIEKSRAWHNENEDTRENGTPISLEEMPDPTESEVEIVLEDHNDGTASGKARVKIEFTNAGYYVYKITENPISVDGAETVSDNHSYFAVIYVCNKTDEEGNTVPGVYVHDITSYRNESGSEEYKPDLSDIAKTTDNNGEEFSENTQLNLGKVGKSSSEEPNVLEAYKMWNYVSYPEPADFTVKKNVTGSLGDRTKQFEFLVTISGTEPGGQYTFTGEGQMSGVMTNGFVGGDNNTLISDDDGMISFTYLLRDDDTLTIEDLPNGAEWTVTEAASNHIASYSVSPGICAIDPEKANNDSEMEITADGKLLENTTVDFVNGRDMTVVTGLNSGIPEYALAAALFVILVLLAAGIMSYRRRKHVSEN